MEMLASAQVELGLSRAEFFNLTPAQFTALQKVRLAQIYRRNYRSGVIACLIRTACGDAEAKIMDFFEAKSARQEMVDTASLALKRQLAVEARERKRRG